MKPILVFHIAVLSAFLISLIDTENLARIHPDSEVSCPHWYLKNWTIPIVSPTPNFFSRN